MGAAVALAAGLLLGEYAFGGLTVLAAGVLVGLFVSEAAVAAAGGRSSTVAATGALATVAGLLLAGWTSTGHRLGEIDVLGWLALPAGAAAAAVRAWPRRSAPTAGAGSPPATGQEP